MNIKELLNNKIVIIGGVVLLLIFAIMFLFNDPALDTRTSTFTTRESQTQPSVGQEEEFQNLPPLEINEDIFADNAIYRISYFPDEGIYSIIIRQAPFDENRAAAEAELLKQPAFAQVADPCMHRVIITTPYYVSEEHSGKNLPLSICE